MSPTSLSSPPRRFGEHPWLGPLGWLGSMAVFAFLVRRYYAFPSTVEDSFILFRYASHFAAHQGLAWNPGLPRDQGMTGIAWASIVGWALRLFGGDVSRVAGYLGIAVGCCTLSVFYRALRGCMEGRSSCMAVVGTFALAICPYFDRHAASGMETGLSMLLYALIVYAAVALPLVRPFLAIATTALLVSLSFVVRPDAPLFCLSVLVPCIFWSSRPATRRRTAFLALAAGVGSAGCAALLLGRYFTTPFPLPVYLKLSLFEILRHPRILRVLVPSILTFQTQFFSVAAIWLVLVLLSRARMNQPLDARLKAILLGSVVFFLYLFNVIPIMNFAMRYQVPLLIPTIFLGTLGLGALLENLPLEGWNRVAISGLLCGVAIFNQVGAAAYLRAEALAGTQEHEIFKPLGQRLSEIPGVKVASPEAGVLAFYSNGQFLDLIGLNNTFVTLNDKRPGYASLLEGYMANSFGFPDLYVRKVGYVDSYADLCTMPGIISRYDFAGEVNGAGTPELFVLRGSKASGQLNAIIRELGMLPAPRANHPAPMTTSEGCAAADEDRNTEEYLHRR